MLKRSFSGVLSGVITLGLIASIPPNFQPSDNGGPGTSQPTGTRLYHRASGR